MDVLELRRQHEMDQLRRRLEELERKAKPRRRS
jgi:hypothetical protein